ncbi:hypothetical protein LSCM1_06689 [Leishmania martiniquensis]|uniref:Phosphatidic acid phosphatase type 2/haloperoxidase domain-containing protein n=1 Tax=Leishmania martiniquensis TaxID=1580590 RepID=A0A836KWX0_9TRYP|nr:hypothetical protein LSCM1_06689 [Leishmania martiniquensis]
MPSCSVGAVWRFIFFFRLHDYLLCLICGFLALGVSKVRPHCRPFSWTDPSIDFPYGGAGTFPSWTLPIISVLPAVAYVLGEAARHCWLRRRSGGLLAHDPFTKHTWLFLENQRHNGDALGPSGAERRCFDVAAPPLASPKATRSPLSGNSQRKIEVVATEMLTLLKVEAQEMPNDSPATPVESPHRPLSLPTSANAREGLTDNCHAPAAAQNSSLRTADNVPQKRTVRLYTLARPWQRFLLHTHMWVLLQAFSIAFSMLIVSAVKVYAGRLRPDFLARLRAEGFTPASVDVDFCAVPKDGRVSFPSGHSGISFAAFVPFCFYVLHSLHAFRLSGVSLWRIVIGLLPLILPITVAVSRTRDNRHFFDDVIAGSAIGIVSALIALKVIMAVNGCTGQLTPRFPYCE